MHIVLAAAVAAALVVAADAEVAGAEGAVDEYTQSHSRHWLET
jgi:hypothetical protein